MLIDRTKSVPKLSCYHILHIWQPFKFNRNAICTFLLKCRLKCCVLFLSDFQNSILMSLMNCYEQDKSSFVQSGSLIAVYTRTFGMASFIILLCFLWFFSLFEGYITFEQNRSTKGCSKLKRSVDMTSSGKNGLKIGTHASPNWDRSRCPEE